MYSRTVRPSRHASEKKRADLAEPSLIPEPGVSEGRQRRREWQHVNGHPERLGFRDERTIARHDEMTLDARNRLGDARHEIEKTQFRAADLADRIEVDNSHFKTPDANGDAHESASTTRAGTRREWQVN